uniref:Vesicle-fusing ATPase n=1 Tax=Hanusia phi TaxID=3032 RepID=A0A7S0EMV1_9CRYP
MSNNNLLLRVVLLVLLQTCTSCDSVHCANSNTRTSFGSFALKFPMTRLRGGRGIDFSGKEGAKMRFKTVTCPDKTLALTNKVVMSDDDASKLTSEASPHGLFVKIGDFIFQVEFSSAVSAGNVGMNMAQRRSLKVSTGDEVELTVLIDVPCDNLLVALCDVSVDFAGRSQACDPLSCQQVASSILDRLKGQIVTVGQSILLDVQGLNVIFKVTALSVFKQKPSALTEIEVKQAWGSGLVAPHAILGLIDSVSQISVSAAKGSALQLKDSVQGSHPHQVRGSKLFSPEFSLESLGIGGLSSEVGSIFRRAFASRVYPPSVLSRMGLKHIRGVLLYGPPGCGKTLIARKIGKLLTDREPKVVNGPEVLSKYVGQSEENIRNLFQDARGEYAAKGDESGLHVIIFDEIDAICKQRGGASDGTGVGDSVVNQLLSYMDGVEELNNLLVIGMTNRKDLLDSALLRPGRFEVHVEIGLPDYEGRSEIARIHMAGMESGNHLDEDVTPPRVADSTENYSGAEIAGVCRAAASYAFDRNIKVAGGHLSPQDASAVKITWEDFEQALEEVKPALGADQENLSRMWERGFFSFGERFEEIVRAVNTFVHQVRDGKTGARSMSLLLTGAPGSGKTAIAAHIASSSNMPCVQLVSAESLLSMSEQSKARAITEAFEAAYRSSQAIVILDGIEQLLGWTRIGPCFSNIILQTISVLLKKSPPSNRRILILATTSNEQALSELEMPELFDTCIEVPTLQDKEILLVLQHMKVFTEEDLPRAVELLGGEQIPMKKLLTLIDLARGGNDKVTVEDLQQVLNYIKSS